MALKIQTIDQSFNNVVDFSSNAVKLLSKIQNSGGYIKLFTEVNSNIRVGDNVVISWYNSTNVLSGITLDNYYSNSGSTDYPYSANAQNYNVLYTDNTKNEIVINKNFTDISISSGGTIYNFYDHYISKSSLIDVNWISGVTDGIIFRNSTIQNCNYEQGLIFSSVTYNFVIQDKYFFKYIALNSQLIDNSKNILGGLTQI